MALPPQEIADRLRSRLPDAIQNVETLDPEPRLEIKAQALRDVCRFLRDDPDLRFDTLMCLSGVDYMGIKEAQPPRALGVVYHLFSLDKRHKITLKVKAPRDNPVVPTVSDIWPTANWHEREAYDLIGITFSGHPDHRRILTSEDWVGHPLRKDYEFPKEYHGVPC